MVKTKEKTPTVLEKTPKIEEVKANKYINYPRHYISKGEIYEVAETRLMMTYRGPEIIIKLKGLDVFLELKNFKVIKEEENPKEEKENKEDKGLLYVNLKSRAKSYHGFMKVNHVYEVQKVEKIFINNREEKIYLIGGIYYPAKSFENTWIKKGTCIGTPAIGETFKYKDINGKIKRILRIKKIWIEPQMIRIVTSVSVYDLRRC